MPARGGKGTTWTPALERHMLILAITAADLKPSTATWELVAQSMGNGITASAVSQKFNKLKRALENGNDGTAATSTPPVTTASATSSQPNKKTAPAAAGIRKRKAAASIEAAKDLPDKKAKQAEEESGNDADLDTEEIDTASPGCGEAEGDQAIPVKLEE